MNWLRTIFTENIALKLLSLALAVGVWGAVGGEMGTEVLLAIPVEFRNVPPNVHYDASPSRVELRVRGPRRLVRAVLPTEFSVSVDLSAMGEPGETTVFLHPADVESPSLIEVVEVIPDQVNLTWSVNP